MLFLTRTVRLPLSPLSAAEEVGNGLVGAHARGLGAVAEMEVECFGTPGESGYLVDITVIDKAVRSVFHRVFADALQREAREGRPTDVPALLIDSAGELASRLPAALYSLTFRPSPFHAVQVCWPDAADTPRNRHGSYPSQPGSPDHPMQHARAASVVFLETFEFAASHRLALADRSDAENRALFGKCSNPNGHGHNYRLEVAVTASDGAEMDFHTIERVVEDAVMRRFDHKHLNLDCPEFAGVNPSVENIAKVVFELLVPAFAAAGGEVRSVRVWETDKTSCRYPA